ncbi:Protein N-acetyltransferase [Pseudomonas syringae pv. actinidiae]|uniref:Protein N-acetyltransferase n=1 Tax=Pseudomonas syringae pv. actinidiae TaxID=103796 RepID=A0AAN4Q2W2_PSESF|nr:Protein N-acetyltransferase [Pseudomonas syringae pv. actinidiae]
MSGLSRHLRRNLRRQCHRGKKSFLSTIVRRSASHAVLDALRPLCGAARHCVVSATAVKKRFLSTIVRRSASACRSGRSASYAWRCASLRRLCHRGKKTLSFNYRATLRVACRSGRSASSVWRCASLRRQCHRGKKALSFNYRATLRVGMPFWTLCVLCVALRVTASPVPSR